MNPYVPYIPISRNTCTLMNVITCQPTKPMMIYQYPLSTGINRKPKNLTGFVLLAFSAKIAPSSEANNLTDLAREGKLQGLADILNDFIHIKTTPYFGNLPIDKILEMKKEAASGEITPIMRSISPGLDANVRQLYK